MKFYAERTGQFQYKAWFISNENELALIGDFIYSRDMFNACKKYRDETAPGADMVVELRDHTDENGEIPKEVEIWTTQATNSNT